MNRRTKRLALLGLLWIVHGVVSALAVTNVGFVGILQLAVANWGAGQVTSDLVVALLLVNTWLLLDGRKQGIPAWPFVLASFAVGSFAPLAYLTWRTLRNTEPRARAVAGASA